MSFGSPKLDIAKTSSTAPVFDKKTTLFDYGFCKKSTSKFPRSFSTTEDTIKAAFDKGKKLFTFILMFVFFLHAICKKWFLFTNFQLWGTTLIFFVTTDNTFINVFN